MSAPNNDTTPTTTEEEGTSIDSNLRYLAYLARIKLLFTRSARYLAYTSDAGEAFRPVVSPWLVRSAYGVSWAYVLGDVGYEGYKERERGSDATNVTRTVVKRTIFQSLASMALPAFTIHQTVNIFSKICGKLGRFQRWGPTIAGLAVVPAMPYIFDHPVEHAVDYAFAKAWPVEGEEEHSHHE